MAEGTAIATTDRATRWSPPQLGPSLQALVEVDAIWDAPGGPPALRGDERREADAALMAYRQMPRGCPPARIAKMMATAAMGYSAQRLTADEADMRVKLYQGELADIHADVLGDAFRMAVRELRFFPTVAEIRAFARRVPTPRRFIVMRRLEQLLARQSEADIAPDDLARPEQLAELVRSLGGSLAA